MTEGAATRVSTASADRPAAADPGRVLVPLVFVTLLFFLWGLSYGLLDTLNKHFQNTLHVSKANSAWLQAAYFGAYFLVSVPAGQLMTRIGYKGGILLGLTLYATGAFLFIPAASIGDFGVFLGALFVIASGLACLESAANPYVTRLGPDETAERRLNLSQSFNGLGSFLGPIIGGIMFFGLGAQHGPQALRSVEHTYAAIGALVVVVLLVFWRLRLPEIKETTESAGTAVRALMQRPHLVLGAGAQFVYVAAQVACAAFFINTVTANWPGLQSERAAFMLSASLLLFTVGRFATTGLMTRSSPRLILTLYACADAVLTAIVALGIPYVSTVALMFVFFFMSIMYPTIFALGVRDLGPATKLGGSAIVSGVAGGAVLPLVMGLLGERIGIVHAYALTTVCFLLVALYGWRGATVRNGWTRT